MSGSKAPSRRGNFTVSPSRHVSALKLAILRKGFTQRQFGGLCGVGADSVSDWCSGRLGPSFKSAVLISLALQESLDQVLQLLRDSGHDYPTEPRNGDGKPSISERRSAARRRARSQAP